MQAYAASLMKAVVERALRVLGPLLTAVRVTAARRAVAAGALPPSAHGFAAELSTPNGRRAVPPLLALARHRSHASQVT